MGLDYKSYEVLVGQYFPLEPRPQSIVKRSGDCHGVDAMDLIRDFPVGTPWNQVPTEALDLNCYSLSFFSDEGFSYYLPSFLLRSLLNNEVYQFTVFSLAPEAPLEQRHKSRLSRLSALQAKCVMMLLDDSENEKGYRHSLDVKYFWDDLSGIL